MHLSTYSFTLFDVCSTLLGCMHAAVCMLLGSCVCMCVTVTALTSQWRFQVLGALHSSKRQCKIGWSFWAGVYTAMARKIDKDGKLIDPVKAPWKTGGAFTTPPGWWHSHVNESDEDAWVLPIQDAGLFTYQVGMWSVILCAVLDASTQAFCFHSSTVHGLCMSVLRILTSFADILMTAFCSARWTSDLCLLCWTISRTRNFRALLLRARRSMRTTRADWEMPNDASVTLIIVNSVMSYCCS